MTYYRLQIDLDDGTDELYDQVTEILKVPPGQLEHQVRPDYWIYAVEEGAEDPYFDFINTFLDLLEPHWPALFAIGIVPAHISFWMLYGYNGQCHMEFDPVRLKRLGDHGIFLCINCWNEGEGQSKAVPAEAN